MTTHSWLQMAADESRHHPWALGSVLRKYMEVESLTDVGLASELRCSPDTVWRLSLCRRPAADRFRADVAAICSRFGIEVGRLVAVIRRVEAVDALGAVTSAESDEATDDAMLLAARDRGDPEDGT